MAEERESATAIEPMLRRAVGDPEVAAQGARDLRGVLARTETEVAAIMRRAEEEVARLGAEADARHQEQVDARLRELAELRWTLTERASVLATRFEAVLDLLEAAELRLGGPALPRPEGGEDPNAKVRAIRMTLRERHRIDFAHEPQAAASADVVTVEGATVQEPAHSGRRRRWWHRWLREAA